MGFQYLRNSFFYNHPFFFYGFDDFKEGKPLFKKDFLTGETTAFRCVISHNPDNIPIHLTEEDLSRIPLILCGHTHGGQIRIPLFGALKTSSVFWKRFEGGLYRHKRTGTLMFVTAGIGISGIPLRLFCPPEALLIDFVSENSRGM